jgi:hypothetical protein
MSAAGLVSTATGGSCGSADPPSLPGPPKGDAPEAGDSGWGLECQLSLRPDGAGGDSCTLSVVVLYTCRMEGRGFC